MDLELELLLERGRGVLLRADALQRVPVHRVERAVRRGELRAIFRNTYSRPEDWLDPAVRRLAGLRSAGPAAALSHTSALCQWDLEHPLAALRADEAAVVPDVHVTVGSGQPRVQLGLVPHRRRGFAPYPPLAVVRDGAPIVRLERALVESWPLIPPLDRRAPVIAAVRGRRTTPARIRVVLEDLPALAGRSSLLALLDLLEDGCHSELEIWGHGHVFGHPALPPLRRQLPLGVNGQVVYVDVAVEEVLLAIELDGRRHHESLGAVERDRRRDVALAALGWQTLRFSGHRLYSDPAGVLAEVLAVIEMRRRLLRSA